MNNVFDIPSKEDAEKYNYTLDVISSRRYWKTLNKDQYEDLKEELPGLIKTYMKLNTHSYEEIVMYINKWL